jgi:predicted ATPase/DNA-binding winged helix-turn-helix (wHTH) protein
VIREAATPREARTFSFGRFRFRPSQKLLERDGAPVPIGGRSLDILSQLIARAGQVVSAEDLIAEAWAHADVDESSLRFHVAALRRTLGETEQGGSYVNYVTGRGYSFVAPVTLVDTQIEGPFEVALRSNAQSLPPRRLKMIGREQAVSELIDALSAERFVTVTGPGGIGKTTVAVTVGHALLPRLKDGVHFLDLSALRNGGLAPSALASLLGLFVHSDNPLPDLLGFLEDKELLLILDSCEHVIDALAPLVEQIFERSTKVLILATSRETLRVNSEHVYRLSPLECPPDRNSLSAAEVLAFPAAQLFFDRASGDLGHLELSAADAQSVCEICVRLDGIPLAIELAAGRVQAYGVQGTAALLKKRLGLLWQGRRIAAARHQTISAALDWSYDLLSESEREALRGMAVFAGVFTFEAACAVIAKEEPDEEPIAEIIADLVAKSLVATTSVDGETRYRLLDMTRAYVLAKPLDEGPARVILRRHAVYYRDFLERAYLSESSSERSPRSLDHCLDNVRAALEWSFSPQGDVAVGVELAAGAAQLFLEFSLFTECFQWTERAISALEGRSFGARIAMELHNGFGVSAMFTRGNQDMVRAAYSTALKAANDLADPHAQLRILSAFHIYMTRVADYSGALSISERCVAVARSVAEPASEMLADWMLGVAHHLLGNQPEARVHCASAMTPAPAPHWASIARFGYDRRTIALAAYSRALWLCGYPDQAAAAARYNMDQAEALKHPLTQCIALIYGFDVFAWIGDFAVAAQIADKIVSLAGRYALGPYRAGGLGLTGKVAVENGAFDDGIRVLRASLDTLSTSRHQILAPKLKASLAVALAGKGQFEAAIETIDAAIAAAGPRNDTADAPELFRVRGEILAGWGGSRAVEAEGSLLRAIEEAQRQGAKGWELRATLSWTRFKWRHESHVESRKRLAALCADFSEGLESSDVKAAMAFLDANQAG